MRSIKTLLAALILTAFALSAQASPGGLDKFGGHTDHKTGQYHFHQLDGKKLAEPLPGEDPNKNGGKIVYTGTPKFSGEAASEKKAPAADAMAAKPAKKAKKAKEPKVVKEPKAEKEKAEPKAAKSEKKEKKAKKSKKEKADKAAADDKK